MSGIFGLDRLLREATRHGYFGCEKAPEGMKPFYQVVIPGDEWGGPHIGRAMNYCVDQGAPEIAHIITVGVALVIIMRGWVPIDSEEESDD